METNDTNEDMVMCTKVDKVMINPSQVNISTQVEGSQTNSQSNSFMEIFKECLKNHASSIGAYSLDGCCEFLPAGDEGTNEFFKCAACDCHKNFHRKETVIVSRDQTPISFTTSCRPQAPTPVTYYQAPGTTTSLHLPSSDGLNVSRHDLKENLNIHHVAEPINGGTSAGKEGSSNSKKRIRTKFTHEQKEKMLDFAGKLSWKIHKKNENVVEEFCNEIGVKLQVFKVWVHNNKNTLGKKP